MTAIHDIANELQVIQQKLLWGKHQRDELMRIDEQLEGWVNSHPSSMTFEEYEESKRLFRKLRYLQRIERTQRILELQEELRSMVSEEAWDTYLNLEDER